MEIQRDICEYSECVGQWGLASGCGRMWSHVVICGHMWSRECGHGFGLLLAETQI